MTTPTPRKRGRPAKPHTTHSPVEDVVVDAPTEDVVVDALTEDIVLYRIEMNIGGTIITNEGLTMLEALKGLQRPTKIITKGTIKVFHGDNSKELFFMPLRMKRMFYPLAQTTMAKMLAMNI